MSNAKEIRIDVTPLFYPEHITPPGDTPLNIKDIRKKFDEVIQKEKGTDYVDNFNFTSIFTDYDDERVWFNMDAGNNIVDMRELLHKTAKEFYGEYLPSFDKCGIHVSELEVSEYGIVINL